jgi:hypothetical protein
VLFVVVGLAIILVLAGVAGWRRRGRSGSDLIDAQRNTAAAQENQLRRRTHPWGRP